VVSESHQTGDFEGIHPISANAQSARGSFPLPDAPKLSRGTVDNDSVRIGQVQVLHRWAPTSTLSRFGFRSCYFYSSEVDHSFSIVIAIVADTPDE
jgi:hypothetical protein